MPPLALRGGMEQEQGGVAGGGCWVCCSVLGWLTKCRAEGDAPMCYLSPIGPTCHTQAQRQRLHTLLRKACRSSAHASTHSGAACP